MLSFRSFGAIFTMCLACSGPAAAQGILAPILSAISIPGQNAGTSAIGPDGTYYVLVPAAGATPATTGSELMAIGVAATPATKWTVTLTGNITSILPGGTTVFAVENTLSGTGRSITTTTSILPLSTAAGTQGTAISPAGDIVDIQVRTIGGADYLYIQTTSTTKSQSGGTTTVTTTRTLTIYSQTGAVIKTVVL